MLWSSSDPSNGWSRFWARISAYGLLLLLLWECLSRRSWWTWRLRSVSSCGLLSPPFGRLWGWYFGAVDLYDALVFELAGSVVFPPALEVIRVSQAICVIFLISCIEGLPWCVLSTTWVRTHGWRFCKNKDLKVEFSSKPGAFLPWKTHASNVCNNLWDAHDGNV